MAHLQELLDVLGRPLIELGRIRDHERGLVSIPRAVIRIRVRPRVVLLEGCLDQVGYSLDRETLTYSVAVGARLLLALVFDLLTQACFANAAGAQPLRIITRIGVGHRLLPSTEYHDRWRRPLFAFSSKSRQSVCGHFCNDPR